MKYPELIRFIPFAPYDRIPELHRLADIFILPSRPTPQWEEQFGYVLVEAMACGIPVISTRSGSIPDIIGESGELIPHSSPELIGHVLKAWIHDPELRAAWAQKALARARTHFDALSVSRQIENFYTDLVSS